MATQNYWFVGAYDEEEGDQMQRMVREGIWENGWEDRHLDLVKSIRPGDRIAIKAAYIRKNGLPFDNQNQSVSVMAIKAIGTVTENPGDGRVVKVKWEPLGKPREWYFYTYMKTIWRVVPGKWEADALIAFTFDGQPQDITRFRNAPFWKDRFGDKLSGERQFKWTSFYQAVADKLLLYRDRRPELVAGIHAISKRVDGLGYLQDHFVDGTSGPLKDICPFTAMGIFNRGITDANRKAIAGEFATFLGVDDPVPSSFEGIPVLNNQKSWFFNFEKSRRAGDIDALWRVFAAGIGLADAENVDVVQREFAKAYDEAHGRNGVAWNLTFGLYWIRPWHYLSLDNCSRKYIESVLRLPIECHGPKGRCNAEDYLKVIDLLRVQFEAASFPVRSFPQLSLAAWNHTRISSPPDMESPTSEEDSATDGQARSLPGSKPYSLDDAINGLFISRVEFASLLADWGRKKNAILQGPPGVGKTFVAKRLA